MLLNRIRQLNSPSLSIAKQALELSDLFRRGDDQNFTDARQHQRSERVIDQRFVVNREQLLRSGQGQWIESRSAPPRQNNALAVHTCSLDVTMEEVQIASLTLAFAHPKHFRSDIRSRAPEPGQRMQAEIIA